MKNLRIILFIGLILAAAFNLLSAYAQAVAELSDHKTIPLHSLGFQFMGLESVFNGVRTAGYYTDKDLVKNTIANAQYEQAQYMLAPTVLDLNHTQYHWVIFDCTTPLVAIEAIKHFGFTAMKSRNGIILAYNSSGS